MKTNKALFTCFVLLSCLSSKAQPMDVIFSYDDSGNRILREKLYLPESSLSDGDSILAANDETIGASERADARISKIAGRPVYLYPNPTQGHAEVELGAFDADTDKGDWLLVSQNGTILQRSEKLEQKVQLDLSHYPSGRYILKMNLNVEHKEWVIVKQ